MGFAEYFFAFLSYFGLYWKNATLVMVGLDNAGKTSLLYRMRTGHNRVLAPTTRPNEEQMSYGTLQVRLLDMGGHDRYLWREYFIEADAILFIVDSADVDRILEAREELQNVLSFTTERGMPLAIFSNKRDLNTSLGKAEFTNELGISEVLKVGATEPSEPNTPISLFEGSVTEGVGYQEMFQWLETVL